MRHLILTAALLLSPAVVMADESIAGQWQAHMGHGVIIVMDVLVDGHWASETVQDNKVVAQMAGTYRQTATSATHGRIVWTPVKSSGDAKLETDDYTLKGNVLRLTNNKETMVFHKQPLAK